jgi:hypothetical protein
MYLQIMSFTSVHLVDESDTRGVLSDKCTTYVILGNRDISVYQHRHDMTAPRDAGSKFMNCTYVVRLIVSLLGLLVP